MHVPHFNVVGSCDVRQDDTPIRVEIFSFSILCTEEVPPHLRYCNGIFWSWNQSCAILNANKLFKRLYVCWQLTGICWEIDEFPRWMRVVIIGSSSSRARNLFIHVSFWIPKYLPPHFDLNSWRPIRAWDFLLPSRRGGHYN